MAAEAADNTEIIICIRIMVDGKTQDDQGQHEKLKHRRNEVDYEWQFWRRRNIGHTGHGLSFGRLETCVKNSDQFEPKYSVFEEFAAQNLSKNPKKIRLRRAVRVFMSGIEDFRISQFETHSAAEHNYKYLRPNVP